MKLKMSPRPAERKSDAKRIRRAGDIPAVIYVQGKACETITVPSSEFNALLRQVPPGRLPTTVFSLTDDKGKPRKAIIKEIQYNVTTYDVIHLDFEELHDNVKVNVKVPIEFVGVADCIGIKGGGVLRQVIRYLKVNCFPRDIPAFFELDVRDLDQRQARRLADLPLPKGVRPMANMNEVAVVIVKR